jgi:hypothetical protein
MVLNLKFEIPNAFALAVKCWFEVTLVFQYESHDKVNDHRASERKKRKIDKVHADVRGFDTKLLAPPFTNTEGLLFKPGYYLIDHKQI